MYKSSHNLNNNTQRVGKKVNVSNNKHSFEDIKKTCKEKLNTLTDCTGNCYNIQTLRFNTVYVTKYRVNEYDRVLICSNTKLHIKELPNYVDKEYKMSFPGITSYNDGLHEEKRLVKEDK